MDDHEIIGNIDRLVEEEHQLRHQHELEPLGEQDSVRLRTVEEALDQCWDLLRQRRARRNAGLDPDAAESRDTDVVERYQQ
jgi:Protein of unknown function (DUF2630)